jgi:hypothetical protein
MRPITLMLLLCACVLAVSAHDGSAQERPASLAEMAADHLSADAPWRTAPGVSALQQNTASRDTLKNGALVGAIVGAAATFAFGMYLCHAIREEGDPPCLKPALVLAAVGGGAGALVGAGIDALRLRHPTLSVSVRF